MDLTPIQYLIGAGAGGLVGLTLGLFGGGGSILAVPLLVYVVGVGDAHLALGTAALAVAANAAANLVSHARLGHVKWRCAGIYSVAGVVGALGGSTLGKAIDGTQLLFLFALLMLVISALMFRRRHVAGDPSVVCTIEKAPRTASYGAATGVLSGFFGIGGGFLIVPGMMAATGMPIIMAVGSSLVAVTAFGLTTALNYAASGLVDWGLAAVFIFGGALGGAFGAQLGSRLAVKSGMLNAAFAALVLVVAGYMLWRSGVALFTT